MAAGVYARVDDHSYRLVILEQEGRLPAPFDGHSAWYCAATCRCTMRSRLEQQAQNAS